MPSPAVLVARSYWRSCRGLRHGLSIAQPSRRTVASPIAHSSLCPSSVPLSSLLSNSSVFARSFASAPPAVSSADSTAVSEPSDEAAIHHFLSSLPTSLADLAPKFTSWPHLIHSSSRQLKALGLSVKQRKAVLYHTELYKARQRRREMLHYLAQPDTRKQSAVDVQQALYDIAYAHVYGRQWKRAEEREAQHWWRQATEMNRLRKTFIRNQWNGIQIQTNPESIKPLRNPELMKEKLKAEIDNLKEMAADGTSTLLDRMDLLEHEQLMDENERADMAEVVQDRLQEMAEDEELREDIKVNISKHRQERLLDSHSDAQRDKEEADRDREERELEERIMKELKLNTLQQQQRDDQPEEEDEDESEQYAAMSQPEQDKVNPYMEEGMNEEQKENARLEMEVDRTIFSKQVREAVMTDMELTLLDYDRDDDFVDEIGLGLEDDILDDTEMTDKEGESEKRASGTAPPVSLTLPAADADAQSSYETPTVARRMQDKRQQSSSMSKLFSYNGRKADQ